MICPLCQNNNNTFYYEDKFREYRICEFCDLVFVPHKYLPNNKDEKERYLEHNNSPDDQRYISFLSKIANPVKDTIPTGSRGLDFGSGPSPVLVEMLNKYGYNMSHYDPFFNNNKQVLKKKYDFITLCEVIEHIHNPHKVLEDITKMLKSKGLIAIMTSLNPGKAKFSDNWYYKNDLTHVCFYSENTFKYISKKYMFNLKIEGNTILLKGQ
jgi:SAM-dependent methyltransferase